MSAPEKIWARPDPATVYMDGSSPLVARDREFSHATEYIRADIAERQLAEMRLELGNYRTLAESKVISVRDLIIDSLEAERDRLAAENASRDRLIYHLVSWIENEAGAELPLDEDQFNLACSIRAALDTAKGAEK